MKSTSSPSAPFVIPSLDGLRAVSFLLVFLGHAGLSWVPAGFGVTVFFFLSGYLITTLLRLEYQRTERVDLKLFYLRRLLRIWPPFYLVLFSGVALALLGGIGTTLEGPSVAAQALHIWNYWVVWNEWQGVVPGSGVYWSLAVEEHFYFLFPALFLWVNRRGFSARQQAQVFLAICALMFLWRVFLVYGLHVSQTRTFVSTDTRFDSILFGCVLAVFKNPALDAAAPASSSERPPLRDVLALMAGFAVLLFSLVYRNEAFRETARYSLQGLALFPLFSAAIRFPRWLPFRVLNVRPLRFLGTLSYSAYLVHYSIINASEDWFPSWSLPTRVVVCFAACFFLSYAIWYCVEEPFSAMRRKLSRAAEKHPVGEVRSPAEGARGAPSVSP